MDSTAKKVILSGHALQRMRQRGASVPEVEETIRTGNWKPAQRGKWHARKVFSFKAISPVNHKHYRVKAIDVVFADDPQGIVVVTVKVFYDN
jgi:hypothetical protein